ncbi:DNA repair protein RecO [Chlamydia avium]|uniref:DNA repair protein RecO n=1 Tax=Chlamydia avium TaxID=1457141 RepID=A0ABP2X7X6_9CHLA|nr:DNA repair protein RecO [Chlamydia avium]EPP36557.1 DNA repair protein RecO [Chlamydia psittaci 10_743_SC13]EPP38757.1 DNA repair protein RecO [Chlamydia avium]
MHTRLPGIVLQNLPSEKTHCITTIFSPLGLLTFFVKQGQTLHCPFREALIPLSLGAYTLDYAPPKMHRLVSAELYNVFTEIKTTYSYLQAAGKISQSLLVSQWQEKPSPKLFSLLFNFLHRLPESKNPNMFAATFLLKLLQYEGCLDLSPNCSQCKQIIHSSNCYRYQGLKFCNQHKPPLAIPIKYEEEQILHALVHAKHFQELLHLSNFPLEFSEKIVRMFESTLPKKQTNN